MRNSSKLKQYSTEKILKTVNHPNHESWFMTKCSSKNLLCKFSKILNLNAPSTMISTITIPNTNKNITFLIILRLWYQHDVRNCHKPSIIIPFNFRLDESDLSLFIDTHLNFRSIRSFSLGNWTSATETSSYWVLYLIVLISTSFLTDDIFTPFVKKIHVKVTHQWFSDGKIIN